MTNPTFEAHIGNDLVIGRAASPVSLAHVPGAEGLLTLGSNSTLHVGTAEQRANLTIGLNAASGAVSGVFDALNAAAVLDLHLNELNVGMGTGTTVGTLRWNQTEVLDANTVTFGRGASTGLLDVPAGGTLLLGSPEVPVTSLRIAYNDTTGGTAKAALDFSVTNPTFEAHIGNDLVVIGRAASPGV